MYRIAVFLISRDYISILVWEEIHTVPHNRSKSKNVYDSKLVIQCMVFIKLGLGTKTYIRKYAYIF